MEENQDIDVNELQVNLEDINAEIENKKEDLVKKLTSEEMEFPHKENKQEFGEIIGELFYNSVKTFFDIGFMLANNLNLEFLTEEKKQENKQKKE